MTLQGKQTEGSRDERMVYDRLVSGAMVPVKKQFRTLDKLQGMLKLSERDLQSGRYRILLYRFLTDMVPLVSAVVWTWGRLSAAPGKFRILESKSDSQKEQAAKRLDSLLDTVYHNVSGAPAAGATFLVDLFTALFRDGMFGGFLTVKRDASGVDRFIPVDPVAIHVEEQAGMAKLFYEHGERSVHLDHPDFYFIPLSGSYDEPLGRSILKAVPFVSYIEQQLVDDMRRTSHNSGYHRLHVKITPPERMAGESDSAYIERINSYFDSTVSMIRSCNVDENPVTWDNVLIEYIGPENPRSVTNSWFLNHRAMVEEICAGTNLAPFLLGYSYGATTTWSSFKFDMVMRQIRSVQAEVARFLEWIAHVDLALAGLDVSCRFEFDNTFPYRAVDEVSIETNRVANIIKLYEAGLIDKETAIQQVGGLF